jgi:hypothetical protein
MTMSTTAATPTDTISADQIEMLDALGDMIAFAHGVEASLFGVMHVTNTSMIAGPINLHQDLIKKLEAFEERLDRLLRPDRPAPRAPAKHQRPRRRAKGKRS